MKVEDLYVDPLEEPPSASYALYNADMSHPQASGSSPGSWNSDYKQEAMIEHYVYEVPQHAGPVINYPEIDFNAYEALAFHGNIPGETMNMADHPYL